MHCRELNAKGQNFVPAEKKEVGQSTEERFLRLNQNFKKRKS